MELQKIFETVARHLLTQKLKCTNRHGSGAYHRPANNLRCAIGCLIPDALYTKHIEGKDVADLLGSRSQLGEHMRKLTGFVGEQDDDGNYVKKDERILDVMADLQSCHDEIEPYNWAAELRAVAHRHKLDASFIPHNWPAEEVAPPRKLIIA